jgi:dipeptidase E
MRLYLSSYQWGEHPETILELLGKDKRHAAIITNAADQFPEDGILDRLKHDQIFLKGMGISSARLDLRDYFDKSNSELETDISKFGFIWVRGANVFVLRRAFRKSGFDKILMSILDEDKIVYGGYSAGACIMGNTLRGLDLVDDAYIAPAGYDPEPIWDGLNLLPYAVVPHYKSDHPESPSVEKTVQYYDKNHIPYKTLRDGEAIVINDGH